MPVGRCSCGQRAVLGGVLSSGVLWTGLGEAWVLGQKVKLSGNRGKEHDVISPVGESQEEGKEAQGLQVYLNLENISFQGYIPCPSLPDLRFFSLSSLPLVDRTPVPTLPQPL